MANEIRKEVCIPPDIAQLTIDNLTEAAKNTDNAEDRVSIALAMTNIKKYEGKHPRCVFDVETPLADARALVTIITAIDIDKIPSDSECLMATAYLAEIKLNEVHAALFGAEEIKPGLDDLIRCRGLLMAAFDETEDNERRAAIADIQSRIEESIDAAEGASKEGFIVTGSSTGDEVISSARAA